MSERQKGFHIKSFASGHRGIRKQIFRLDEAPLDDLLVLLEDKTEVPLVRASALQALGELGERVPIEVIIAALRDDEWPVREVAAITLGTLGERTPGEPLIYALEHDDVEFVRTALHSPSDGWLIVLSRLNW